jgi:hypothetical protein
VEDWKISEDVLAAAPEYDGFGLSVGGGWGLRRGDKAYCLHCEREIEVSAVLDDLTGDWCPTPGCDGGGWGIDLFAEKWWQ